MTGLHEKSSCIDRMYLDFCKAVDVIPHDILISSLALHGINRSPIMRIKKCLNNKFQNVVF